MISTLENPEVLSNAGSTTIPWSLGVGRGLTERELSLGPLEHVTTFSFLMEERDEVRRRSLRHLLLILGLELVILVVVLTVIRNPIPGPWWLRFIGGIIVAPLGAQVRFFQNRYKEDLRERERLRERIRRTTANGL